MFGSSFESKQDIVFNEGKYRRQRKSIVSLNKCLVRPYSEYCIQTWQPYYKRATLEEKNSKGQ